MGVFDRNKGIPNAKPNWWVSYTVTDELRIKHGLEKRYVREPGGTSQRIANAVLAQRKREVKDGTWRPDAPGSGITVAAYVEEWIEKRKRDGVRSVRNEAQRLRQHVVPVIGHRRLAEIRRKDIAELLHSFRTTISKKTGLLPAPRMVHRVYEDIRTMYAHAVEVDEIVPASPCSLRVKRGELPAKRDRDKRWRKLAVYSRGEIQDLICDERVPWNRRVTYALLFLTGSRIGEIVARRWVDYVPDMAPLGQINVLDQHGGEDTKTGTTREVPVHPVLAAVLAKWRLEGFPLFFKRRARDDDYIVPRLRTRGGKPATVHYQDSRRVWVDLQADLTMLGHRRRRVHDMRRTLASLAIGDGADKYLLKWITHGRQKEDVFDEYVEPPWPALCEQISCLRIELRRPGGAEVVPIRKHATDDV